MTHRHSHPNEQPATNAGQAEANFVPSPDEVARRAYFTYVNQGAPPGRDVQHWLDAEAELIAERNRTRVHGYRN
jgi:hypothetical protein